MASASMTSRSMSGEEVDWGNLPEDIIQELLYNDMADDEMEKEINSIDKLVEDSKEDPMNCPAAIMREVNPEITLSEYGEAKVRQLVQAFATKGESAAVVKHYPSMALESTMFFKERLPDHEAPKLLLDVMRKIATHQTVEDQPISAEIRKYENDTLEYVGGYTLKKAIARFPQTIVECLCSDKHQGSLITLMERKAGALMYPSEEYLLFLQHVYLKFSREVSRKPTNICFTKVAEEVFCGQYYRSFLTRWSSLCDGEVEEAQVEEAAEYITKLVVRILSHSFARKLFAKLHDRVTNGAVGLRGLLAS